MKREIIYIVHVGYYEFKFYSSRNALTFAQEALRSNLEKGGLPARIELKWEETDDQDEDDEETIVDIEVLREGGETE